MTPRRKNPAVAFWATVVVVVGLAYVASFWSACWLVGNGLGYERVAGTAYYPLLIATIELPKSTRDTIFPDGGNAKEGVLLMSLSVRLLDLNSYFFECLR